MPGAGAAGGAGFGAVALLGAEVRSGIETVLELVGFDDAVAGADLVVTGEGSLDAQSLRGKAPMGVLVAAGRLGVPVVAVCGRSLLTPEELRAAGLRAHLVPVRPRARPGPLHAPVPPPRPSSSPSAPPSPRPSPTSSPSLIPDHVPALAPDDVRVLGPPRCVNLRAEVSTSCVPRCVFLRRTVRSCGPNRALLRSPRRTSGVARTDTSARKN